MLLYCCDGFLQVGGVFRRRYGFIGGESSDIQPCSEGNELRRCTKSFGLHMTVLFPSFYEGCCVWTGKIRFFMSPKASSSGRWESLFFCVVRDDMSVLGCHEFRLFLLFHFVSLTYRFFSVPYQSIPYRTIHTIPSRFVLFRTNPFFTTKFLICLFFVFWRPFSLHR